MSVPDVLILISPIASYESLERMGVQCNRLTNVGAFTSGQKEFLSYHRDNVFLKQRRSG